ncbi:MAG: HlyD family efflux transporter periplasmic adaptor subunit [Chitinophagaceae bacterium]|nr:MAG: HlyD family efflux transporter periplasmic adaptor subunit [Chitinophagaceae bacterium]
MNKTFKWILFFVIGLAVAWLVAKAVLGKGNDSIKVTAENVKRRTVVETVSASGKVYPATEIKVGSPIAGEVILLNVQEGDTVKKGQVLARIQGEKSSGGTQRISLPNVPPGFEGLMQGMQTQRPSTASSATINASISGTILGLNVKAGERIGAMQMPGSELMRIADMNNIEVRVDVNENNIIKVSVGDSADVEVDAYNKRKFKGVVTSIGNGNARKDAQSFLSADVTSYEVHIRLLPSSYADLFDSANRRRMPFRPNMNARADIKTKRKEGVLTVPVGAVTSRPQGADEKQEDKKSENENSTVDETNDDLDEVVYVVKADKTVEKRVVTTGIQDFNYFEIISGLKEGEQVVTGPNTAVGTTLRTGKKVAIVKKEQLFENK